MEHPPAAAPAPTGLPPALAAELVELRALVKQLRAENATLKAKVTRFTKPRKVPPAYAKLGEPPEDPLAAAAWVHRALVVSARRAIADTSISEAESRAELSRLAAQIKDLIPTSRLKAAESIVQADNAAVMQGSGPELVHAPPADSAAGTRPPSRRGRPPKRSLR